MKSFAQLIVLLPCHGLEDFPTHHTGKHAEGLLAHWTALWHPSLIAASQKAPEWFSTDFLTISLDNVLLSVPAVCSEDLPPEAMDAVEDGRAVIVAGKRDRESILQDEVLAEYLDPKLNPQSVADFLRWVMPIYKSS